MPNTPFPHLRDAISALKAAGFAVSVDSLNDDDLLLAGKAGADYLLSLTEDNLWIADEVASTPILIPAKAGSLPSLYRAIEAMRQRNRRFIADAILDPIPFGFTDSIVRYQRLRTCLCIGCRFRLLSVTRVLPPEECHAPPDC